MYSNPPMDYLYLTHSSHQWSIPPTYLTNPSFTTPTTPSFPSFPWELFSPYYTNSYIPTPSPYLYFNHGYSPHPPNPNPYSFYSTSHYSYHYTNYHQQLQPTKTSSKIKRDCEKHLQVFHPCFKKRSKKTTKKHVAHNVFVEKPLPTTLALRRTSIRLSLRKQALNNNVGTSRVKLIPHTFYSTCDAFQQVVLSRRELLSQADAINTQDDDDDGDMEDEDQRVLQKPQDDLELSDTESDLDQTLQFLSQRFRNTRSPAPNPRRQAESSLSEAANTPNFGLVVLRLIAEPAVDAQIRQSPAVNFKNHLRLRWTLEESSILEAEKEHIKTLSISLMLAVSPKTHYQLSEALTIIGKHDFPKAWPTLLPELVASLQNASQSHSNDLWIDLKHFLDNFAAPLLEIFLKTVLLIDAATTAVPPPPMANLRQLFESRKLYCSLFYSLNFQELPEFFADHVREWMSGFRKYLTTSYPILEGNGDGLALVDELRAFDCDNINHYMEKYEEEFKGFLNDFALVVWTLLGNMSQSSSLDQLAITAIKFFTTISTDIHHNFFAPDRIIPQIFQGIVIPNVRLREDDEELFEINLIEYIRRVRKVLEKLRPPSVTELLLSYNGDSCQIQMLGLAKKPPDGSQSNIACDCSSQNDTFCHAVRMEFKGYNLPGTFPPQLVKLPYLKVVYFALNYLNSTIPKEWGSIELTSISLLVNRLSGEIPKELGNITTLTYLNLEAIDVFVQALESEEDGLCDDVTFLSVAEHNPLCRHHAKGHFWGFTIHGSIQHYFTRAWLRRIILVSVFEGNTILPVIAKVRKFGAYVFVAIPPKPPDEIVIQTLSLFLSCFSKQFVHHCFEKEEKEHLTSLKPRFDTLNDLVNVILKVTKCVIEFHELPVQYNSHKVPAYNTAFKHILVAAYWCIRSIMVCASQITSLTTLGYEIFTSIISFFFMLKNDAGFKC
ncbi:uncharacterized protein LOC131660307 [Vicia villosa]|uniref:uncharacterized protein LOC131660307 n=1 Tax=Vicia villosa TaxID=3911 RepID=UPI00273B0905|nr:uncharacterized protein LOC131660307 [Vicia villosa]